MKLEIIAREKNPLLKREEISFEITEFKATPSRKELKEKICSVTDSKNDLVVIRKISHEFGSRKTVVNAVVYADKGHMQKLEPKFLVNRDLGIRGKAEAGSGKAEKKEEKPAEGKAPKK